MSFLRWQLISLLLLVSCGCVSLSHCSSLPPVPHKIGDRWGYVLEGRVVIPATYLQVRPFSDGLAAVCVERHMIDMPLSSEAEMKGLWGYINIDGEMVIQPQFLAAKDFTDGYAEVALIEVGTQPNIRQPKGSGCRIDKAGVVVCDSDVKTHANTISPQK